MYDKTFLNFNVLCDKTTQIELVKKKTTNQNKKSEEESKMIQTFSE